MSTPLILDHQSAGPWDAIALPGDKSIAHRALLCAALATGESVIRNVPASDDVAATLACLRALGVAWTREENVVCVIGCSGQWASEAICPVGASGTTLRLLMGLLAGAKDGRFILQPAPQLARRPMQSVVDALTAMGARIELSQWGTDAAQVIIEGRGLHGVTLTLTEASAQLKSAVLLAALQADGQTHVTQTQRTRDHLERMLPHFVQQRGWVMGDGKWERLVIQPTTLHGTIIDVPGDPSAAAFFAVGAVLRGVPLQLSNVGLNPLRIGWIGALRRMGLRITTTVSGDDSEPCGSVHLVPASLSPITLSPANIPAVIDELPILLLAACFANGYSKFSGVARLRDKESDRVQAMQDLACLAGRKCTLQNQDTLIVHGDPSRPVPLGKLPVTNDHRIVMAAAMLALRGAPGAMLTINDPQAVTKSYPGFWRVYERE